MNKKLALFLFLGLFTVLFSQESKTYSFAAGFQGGTYDKMARSISQVGILGLQVASSKGSLANIERVKNGEVDFAFCQLDILLNQFKKSHRLKAQIAIVLPLFSEEVHLIAKKKFNTVADLKGAKLAVGEEGSGSYGTAEIVFGASGIPLSGFQLVKSSPADSLKTLLSGEIDAMFLVSGAPVDLLKGVKASEQKNIHILSLAGKSFETLADGYYHYRPAAIANNVYAFDNEDKITLSVANVIIAKRSIPKPIISKLINGIFTKKAELTQKHAKWAEVDPKKMIYYMLGQKQAFHPQALKELATRLRN